MKLPDRLGRRSGRPFHSAIATSFALEFAAVEEILLPQLMASGATNLLLLTDARMTALALSEGSALPAALGRDYALYSPPAANGIFHPKIILQIGRESARAIVSSANLTASGLAGNAEIAVEIECKNMDSPERDIIRSIWRYLDALVPAASSPARDALRWTQERATWLGGPAGDAVHELDGTGIAFLHGPGDTGIADRFVSLIQGAKVQTLTVISPYWDHDLAALADLSKRLSPPRIILPIDRNHHEFPVDARFARKATIVDLQWPSRRFTHAKIIIASTADHDHILFGSANCTSAALGSAGTPGANAEACIYRRLPAGAAGQALGLERWTEAEPIKLSDLSPPIVTSPIPLDTIEALQPGTFELDQGQLIWTPSRAGIGAGDIQLLDRSARMIGTIPVTSFIQIDGRRRAPVEPALHKSLCFARLTTGDIISTLAHITHREGLRVRRREVASGSVARALAPFTDGADFDLWMHQAFETLVRADFESVTQPRGLSAARPQARKNADEPVAPVPLSYDEFTQARLGAGRSAGAGDNSLAGTYSDTIRDFLNLLSGRGPQADRYAEDDDTAFDDLSDEQVDTGRDDDRNADKIEPRDTDKPSVAPAPVDARLYERHILGYTEGLETGEEALGSSDVLRLRYWILFLLYKARCPDLPRGLDTSSALLGWPRFIVRVLVAFFCGGKPAIRRVMLARDFDAMPVDFMECWITILWSLEAIEKLLPNQRKDREFVKYIPELRRRVVSLLGLRSNELNGDIAAAIRAGLDQSIGIRLGLDPIAVRLDVPQP
ncbi:hypothetical protein PX699_07535 [Sphingobium sp. H39-3-25]|uniref:PLD phosphodiesterase domain-containing protein n=1 Tax=Sphingopyxis fribergensis TaxID=1515612 RepID=A0A0A7PBD0_9SPHN|nr:hypothetical protein [Sphingopyxis fribergensis]AJA07285.1 hypothetical protein SKP52_01740 [Sphingopyxis fribergensis]MDF0542189.1 hypothetical protein [Sphingobium arseniciresistens]